MVFNEVLNSKNFQFDDSGHGELRDSNRLWGLGYGLDFIAHLPCGRFVEETTSHAEYTEIDSGRLEESATA